MSLLTILETLLIGPLKLIFEIIFVIANRVLGDRPGFAIIALSMVMNVMLLPLYQQADRIQEESRDKEAKLKPGVDHIKKTFSGDEQMMILQAYYRQNDYRPTDVLNGSVSLLLEVPFFMAAYQFLSNLALLNEVSMGPIQNLGAPDGMLVIGGMTINVLPILMTLVNVISSAIYLKGFPLKTKLQLYGMAGFFLVFLYNSPAGLVFYWTLNNLFSLGKNMVCRLKHGKKIGILAMFAAGIAVLAFGIFAYHPETLKRKLFIIVIGAAMLVPMLWQPVKGKLTLPARTTSPAPDKKLFFLGSVFITVLTGMLIPSTYIAASPQEYVDPSYFHDPNRYIVMATCMAAGMFLVWMRVFYWLASNRGKAVFGCVVWVLSGMMLVNYMFFGRNLGILEPNLKFVEEMEFTAAEELGNLAVLAVLALGMFTFMHKWPQKAASVLLAATVAIASMSCLNMISIRRSTADLETFSYSQDADTPTFPLSKEGKNVVVIMLDRAQGSIFPFILNEKPELKERFDGFTFYRNTVSFGAFTNFCVPSLYGGYEYSPIEMNKRDQELLQQKHNEALKVLPVLFSENGFLATMADPPYANYQVRSDVSIYDAYPEINAFVTEGLFMDNSLKQLAIEANYRNFFCFSMVKSMPVIMQKTFYIGGNYNAATRNNAVAHTMYSVSEAEGYSPMFQGEYAVMSNLPVMTEIREGEVNTFLFLSNDMTHEPVLLQAPEYEHLEYVDNREYDAAHTDRFAVDGISLNVGETRQMSHYHVNMAAMLKLADWFDYLRANGVYDNTRIIVAADHGAGREMLDVLLQETLWGETVDLSLMNPLLLVKDFDSHGFTVSDAFMTNADVPLMAMNGLIQNPVNPFTGKPMDDSEKHSHDQFVIMSYEWSTLYNNGHTFIPDRWFSVRDDLWNPENWQFSNTQTVLKEYILPQ